MITCKSVTHLHTDADEGALTGWDRFRYRFHMAICGPCKAYRKSFEQTVEALHDVPKESAPADVRSAALRALRARRDGTSER